MQLTSRRRPRSLHGNLVEGTGGRFSAFFDEFPDIIAEGENEEQAKKNIIKAVAEVLQYNSIQSQKDNLQQEPLMDKPIKHFEFELA